MRLFFSEVKSDYDNYIFPYAIWAAPDPGESPSLLFGRGFLPNSRYLDRFYLCRHVRVRLGNFSPSSENRRILRKGEGFGHRLYERKEFELTPWWLEFCKNYAEKKFGERVMSLERLDALFASPLISHVLVFKDEERDKDIGLVALYLEEPLMAFYYYSFYDLDYFKQNLGMFMMTSTVTLTHEKKLEFIYLGSCYSRNALYKLQFDGAEFFNGFCWSKDIKELKYLIERDAAPVKSHLLENEDYLSDFYAGGFGDVSEKTLYKI